MREATPTALALATAGLMIPAAPHAARAAALDGALVKSCTLGGERGAPPSECPVDLVKGHDYDFHARETEVGGIVELVNPVGQTVISDQAPGVGNPGRARSS